MDENPFKNQKLGSQERLAVRVEIATPEDWGAYKEIWLLAITGKDAEMFGRSSEPEQVKEAQNRTDQGWKDVLSQKDRFYVLAWEGSRVIGTGMAKKMEKKEGWWMGSGYVREGSTRDKKTGEKIFATRLNEIRNRGGTKIALGVKAINGKSIHIAESFGFRKVEEGANSEGFGMELEDVNAPEVVAQINKALNAG